MENRERGQDETTEQGHQRIVPTRPGRWYAQWAHDEPSDDMIFIASVLQDEHRLFVHLGGVTSDLRALRFIAPIPGPAVLAALAEYGEALAGLDAEPNDRIPTVGIMRAFNDAGDALHAAIRAERDAERDGGA
jgi:hypothetical protein